MFVPHLGYLFILLALILDPVDSIIDGYLKILVSESILLTDYVAVGGVGAALLNSGILILISYYFIHKIKLPVTGSIFAGILTIGGFAFFGKNLINVLIIYLGVYLYAKYRKLELRSVIVVFLFATGLSPISSVVMFGMGLPYLFSIPLGIVIGVFAGFLLVELSSRVITFHRGYDLYNVGFASGILSFVFFSIFRLVGLEYETNLIYTNDSHYDLLMLFVSIALFYLIFGLLISKGEWKEYKNLLRLSGRAVTDFTRRSGMGLTFINIGITSIGALAVILLLDVHINGPVFGGLVTILGFSAFGKHIKNVLPPMVGVFLVTIVFGIDLSVPVVLAIIFSTGLAPIAGEYGIIVGVFSGMLHLPIVTSLGQLHGGVLLYSNGFAAAFTAVIVTTLLTTFRRSRS
jgi:hypothetical protein